MEPARYVYIASLGCPKNLVDTEVMAASLFRAGLGLTTHLEQANLYLINSCAFIVAARQEAEAEIRRALKWKRQRPHRRVVVGGCLPQWDADGDLRAKFAAVDAWLGVDRAPEMGLILGRLLTGEAAPPPPDHTPTFLYHHLTPRVQLTPTHYAYLKIAEGCDNRCAYCSIPRLRGRLRSRRLASVVAEAEGLLANGARELILVAQDTTAFGLDRPDAGEDLPKLLRALDALPGKFWLRLLYAHPASLSRNAQFLADFLACFPNARHLLPYLDLPLQHITDRMLSRMGRRVTRTRIETLLDRLRAAIPNLALRTTFLTGHPGETPADFRALRAFVAARRFERLGVFAYSPEPGTRAARQPGTVAPRLARRRAHEIMSLQAAIMRERHARLAGSVFECIIDSVDGARGVARTAFDAPDVDLTLQVASGLGPRDRGRFRRLRVTAADDDAIRAVPA